MNLNVLDDLAAAIRSAGFVCATVPANVTTPGAFVHLAGLHPLGANAALRTVTVAVSWIPVRGLTAPNDDLATLDALLEVLGFFGATPGFDQVVEPVGEEMWPTFTATLTIIDRT